MGAVVPAQVKRRQINLRPSFSAAARMSARMWNLRQRPGHGTFSDSRSVPARITPGAPACRTPPREKAAQRLGISSSSPHLFGMVDQVQSCGFQPGKTHIVGIFHRVCCGEEIILSSPALRPCPAPRRRIGHPQHPRDLVEGFSRRIVQRRAEDVHVRVVFDLHTIIVWPPDTTRHRNGGSSSG